MRENLCSPCKYGRTNIFLLRFYFIHPLKTKDKKHSNDFDIYHQKWFLQKDILSILGEYFEVIFDHLLNSNEKNDFLIGSYLDSMAQIAHLPRNISRGQF